MKVLVLAPYPKGFSSGQRLRIELWASRLQARGIEFEFALFADQKLVDVLYRPGNLAKKAWGMTRCYAKQFFRVLHAARPDVIYIYREAALIGPGWIERIAARHAPIVYDVDEPVHIASPSSRNAFLAMLKLPSKIGPIVRRSHTVMAANRALAEDYGQWQPNVELVPFTVDTERFRPAATDAPRDPVRIVWTGTFSTQPNLQSVREPLARLQRSHGALLRVIGDEPMTIDQVALEFLPFDLEKEAEWLAASDIGVVPVPEHPWNRWKLFFKTILFMSMGLPVVATPTGTNTEFIQDGVNGFLASTPDEWYEKLKRLTEDPDLRLRIGRAARATAEQHFGLYAQLDQVERILRAAAGTPA